MMIIETAVATNVICLTYQRSPSGLWDAIAGFVGAEVKSEAEFLPWEIVQKIAEFAQAGPGDLLPPIRYMIPPFRENELPFSELGGLLEVDWVRWAERRAHRLLELMEKLHRNKYFAKVKYNRLAHAVARTAVKPLV